MKVYKSLEEYIAPAKPIVTVGTFDGVHIGHQRILGRLKEAAIERGGETLLLTFWPHPRMVLQPENNNLKLLNTIEEKIELLEKAGLDNLVILPFTQEFSRMGSIEFIRDVLVNGLKMKLIIIGYDHQFGKNREGSFEQLQECAPLYEFSVEEIPAQEIGDVTVSSTKIRTALAEGEVDKAANYLGYHYMLEGTVVTGDKLGRQLGFPTANIDIHARYKLIPLDGVYVASIECEEETYYGMLNTGLNPTIEGKGRTLEVHIFNFDKDIYGKNLRIRFLHRLRSEMKFADIDELKEQMEIDRHKSFELLELHRNEN